MEKLTLPQLLRRYKLTERDCNKEVCDKHLEQLSRECHLEWKSLPGHLGLKKTIVDDIEGIGGDQKGKKHAFLLRWKRIKGFNATYKQLITALLEIDSGEDAGWVCKMMQKELQESSSSDSVFDLSGESSSQSHHLVKCTAAVKKCEWEGTVDMLEHHKSTCQFSLIPCLNRCKNENGEVECFMRKDMKEHLEKSCPNRSFECRHCGGKGTYFHISHFHDKVCKRAILPCPVSGCNETLSRHDVDRHVLEECKYVIISCKYKGIGCRQEMERGKILEHEQDDKLHLNISIEKLNSSWRLLATVIFLSLLAAFLTVYILVSQVEALAESQNQLSNSLTELREEHDRQSKSLRCEESMIFKLSGYEKLKESNESFSSPSFYTRPDGYLMDMVVYANGHGTGEGTHVSVYARFLEGKLINGKEEDRFNFTGTVNLGLLNQKSKGVNRVRSIDINHSVQDSVLWGDDQFISHYDLVHTRILLPPTYLQDDTLYFSFFYHSQRPWLDCKRKLMLCSSPHGGSVFECH